MSTERANDQRYRPTRDEILATAKPLPGRDEMLIEDLTDDESGAFWRAINDA